MLFFQCSGDRENSVYREVINKKEKHAIHGVKHGSSELIFYEELPDQTHLCRYEIYGYKFCYNTSTIST